MGTMKCDFFGKCGSCSINWMSYEEQLEHKISSLEKLFYPIDIKNWEQFKSKKIHYRNRAEFRIWHDGDKISYAMHGFDKKPVLINLCPKADEQINKIMPLLLEKIENNPILKERLFSVEFLSATKGLVVTLAYHKPLGKDWEMEAKPLENELGVYLIGRSRGVKKVLSQDAVWDSLHVNDKEYLYYLQEGAFSQPNRSVNAQMIAWVMDKLASEKKRDLLELYCGHGNFTMPLSGLFDKVLATEISKKSIAAALKNCEANGRNNIDFVRLSAQELTQALKKERPFQRLRDVDLDSFAFSHILVDPPRAGMDEESCALASRFQTIIYISCNPQTLLRDIQYFSKTHRIQAGAVFDQFPYTHHLECGVILTSV